MADTTHAPLKVSIVAPQHQVWSGSASSVSLRTTEGEMGILGGHEPTFSELVACVVQVRTPESGPLIHATQKEGNLLRLAIDGGFVSVHHNHVSVLAEQVLLPTEIDTAAEQKALTDAERTGDRDAARQARSRLALVEATAVQH